jgi:diguanylate cyclase (GGDEF)-like protein/PAS domain S-box-containing protein
MNAHIPPSALSRWSAPGPIVALFVLVMSACVLGLVIWKAVDARRSALRESEIDTRNLTHSLAEHASHTIQAVDVAMSGMVDLLKYQSPQPERFDAYLAETARALPQLRALAVIDASGNWRYSSRPDMPGENNSDRDYFSYFRDNSDPGLTINGPLLARRDGWTSIVLAKRISKQDGSFNGMVVGAIDVDYFRNFYKTFDLGENSGITLIRTDGIVLAHWPSPDVGKDLSATQLIQTRLRQSPTGYYRIASVYDGLTKYFAYERITQYPLLVTVAIPHDAVLASWRSNLLPDIVVALVLLCSVILLAALLSTQFQFRINMENALRERESRYRLLADNIADVVVLLDRYGKFVFVSQSVEFVLGLDPKDLIGRSCFELVHPDDVESVKLASAQLTDPTATRIAMFRTYRDDRSLAWVEINFKLAARADDRERIEVVGVLRDVTQRKLMQDELTALNARLSQLATTDGLTSLANRRTLDGFLRREYELRYELSVLLIDIDHFKGYNDSMGHQAGDECLKRVAAVVAQATENTPALSARYGGEEFAIVLPGVSEAEALIVAESVRLKVRALQIPNSAAERGYLTISVGIGSRQPQTPHEAALLGEADLALYEAKRRGRDCCVPASELVQQYFDTGVAQNG